jgi:hypothetical protein
MPLPEWLDPQIIITINEARRIYFTRLQIISMRKNIIIPLSLKRMIPDIIKIIAGFIQVDVIFDTLPIVLPFELLNKDVNQCTHENISSIYLT